MSDNEDVFEKLANEKFDYDPSIEDDTECDEKLDKITPYAKEPGEYEENCPEVFNKLMVEKFMPTDKVVLKKVEDHTEEIEVKLEENKEFEQLIKNCEKVIKKHKDKKTIVEKAKIRINNYREAIEANLVWIADHSQTDDVSDELQRLLNERAQLDKKIESLQLLSMGGDKKQTAEYKLKKLEATLDEYDAEQEELFEKMAQLRKEAIRKNQCNGDENVPSCGVKIKNPSHSEFTIY